MNVVLKHSQVKDDAQMPAFKQNVNKCLKKSRHPYAHGNDSFAVHAEAADDVVMALQYCDTVLSGT